MGKGLPVIASDVGACREILKDGEYGTLVKPHCSISIADSIENTLKDINSAIRKRNYAYKHVLKNYTKNQMSIEYLKQLDFKND